ncbi:MAG: T9SS type A sorting domain-containing protein [Bacteroidia bacterium]|jgi:hypothetical protein
MRKFLLASVLSCFLLQANAQTPITITSADMPMPDKMLIKAKDTLTAVALGMPDTAAQAWNFTAVTEHTRDTSIVMSYADFPNSLFSTANTVIRQGNSTFYGYLINSSSSFSLIGGSGLVDIQGSLTPINQTSDPAEILFTFPASYDSSYTNNFSTDAKFYFGQVVSGFTIDSIHRISSIEKTAIVDAWGTLTTQMGGPYDVIRVKEVKTSYDTVLAYFFGDWNNVPGGITATQTTNYYWWANGIGTALASAAVDSSGNVVNFEWLTEYPGTPPVAASVTSADASCPGQCDGSATVTAKWGAAPYTYSWNTSPAQTTAMATGLCPGTYTVTVTDSMSVSTTQTVTIGMPDAVAITASGATLTATAGTSYQWYMNDTLITGATAMTYTVSQNGNYTVAVTTGSCTDTSAAYSFTTIGIAENSAFANISVYPNPVNSIVTIAFDAFNTKQPVTVEVKNELGQSLKKTVVSPAALNNKVSFDMSALPQGIYFVSMKDNATVINKKFIKQ